MRQTACLISIWVEGIAREVWAIATEGDAPLFGTGVDSAFHGHDRAFAFYFTATLAAHILHGYAELL